MSGIDETRHFKFRVRTDIDVIDEYYACMISGVFTRGTGGRAPLISGRGDSHAKFPYTFLTHNNAIAGFRSQILGLPAYACKTDSSTAIKLAPRMHQNLPFRAQKSKNKFFGEDIATSPHPSQVERGTLPPHIPPSPSALSAPCSSRSPWFAPTFKIVDAPLCMMNFLVRVSWCVAWCYSAGAENRRTSTSSNVHRMFYVATDRPLPWLFCWFSSAYRCDWFGMGSLPVVIAIVIHDIQKRDRELTPAQLSQ